MVIPHCNCGCLIEHFFSFLDSVQQRIDSTAITLTALSIGDLAQTLSAADGTPAAVAVAVAVSATAAAEGIIFYLCLYFLPGLFQHSACAIKYNPTEEWILFLIYVPFCLFLCSVMFCTDSSLNMQSVTEVIDLCADDSDDAAPVTTSSTATTATSAMNAVAAEKKKVKDAKKAAAAVSSSVPKVSFYLHCFSSCGDSGASPSPLLQT